MIGDATQHVGKPSLWIDTVEFRRGDADIIGAASPSRSRAAADYRKRCFLRIERESAFSARRLCLNTASW
jgi:hypothetical protein